MFIYLLLFFFFAAIKFTWVLLCWYKER